MLCAIQNLLINYLYLAAKLLQLTNKRSLEKSNFHIAKNAIKTYFLLPNSAPILKGRNKATTIKCILFEITLFLQQFFFFLCQKFNEDLWQTLVKKVWLWSNPGYAKILRKVSFVYTVKYKDRVPYFPYSYKNFFFCLMWGPHSGNPLFLAT